MIGEEGYSWNHSKPDHDRASPSVVTTPSQALTGLHIGLADCTARCSTCDETLLEGQPIWVYASRAAEATEWVLTRCYCERCVPDGIEIPTLGTSEVLVKAFLDIVSLSMERRHHLCLNEVETLAVSPLDEGAVC